ncbi:hypothetical protein AB0I53_15855 [Saccharopolyspora sp. NPDC050389]|uniref:hypothetical protein n=1 Tax=Saccharopolyspora TaxID=1835 RepID=UPI0033DAD7BB
MADEEEIIAIPPDLKTKFASLGLAESDVRQAREIWAGLDDELNIAAGNDDETARSIKKQATALNKNITEMLSALGDLFNLTEVKGKRAADKHEGQSDHNSDLSNSL